MGALAALQFLIDPEDMLGPRARALSGSYFWASAYGIVLALALLGLFKGSRSRGGERNEEY